MRIKLPVPCPECGADTRKRSSRKMAEGYWVNYFECKNASCGAKFKADEVIKDITEAHVIEEFGLKRMNPKTCALIIVDQQRADSYFPVFQKRNNPNAEMKMAQLLQAWRNQGLTIIHVRHISSDPDSPYAPGHPGVNFKPGFKPLANEHVTDKSISDAFLRSDLEGWLLKRSITQLVVFGATSDGAVEATVRTASNLGFTVWVPDDACYAFEKFSYDGIILDPSSIHTQAMTNLHHGNSTVVDTRLVLQALAHATSSTSR